MYTHTSENSVIIKRIRKQHQRYYVFMFMFCRGYATGDLRELQNACNLNRVQESCNGMEGKRKRQVNWDLCMNYISYHLRNGTSLRQSIEIMLEYVE